MQVVLRDGYMKSRTMVHTYCCLGGRDQGYAYGVGDVSRSGVIYIYLSMYLPIYLSVCLSTYILYKYIYIYHFTQKLFDKQETLRTRYRKKLPEQNRRAISLLKTYKVPQDITQVEKRFGKNCAQWLS